MKRFAGSFPSKISKQENVKNENRYDENVVLENCPTYWGTSLKQEFRVVQPKTKYRREYLEKNEACLKGLLQTPSLDKCHKLPLVDDEIITHDEFTHMEERNAGDVTDTIDETEASELDLTGFFRDRTKRVDLMLVIADDKNSDLEAFKVNYLMNIVKIGLELELEPGLMACHKHLIFIKIHAPDFVLDEYENVFGVKKYFQESHLKFTNSWKSYFEKCFRFIKNEDEKLWIKLIRKHYQQRKYMSNIDRSFIVYNILRRLPFGSHTNHVGIHRLLQRNIILDVYALHDGHYLMKKGATSPNNARQILFYNWVGMLNILKVQPLNLIQEYFGPRIAFYFAFHEFYNIALAFVSMVSVIYVILDVFDSTDEPIRKDTCDISPEVYACAMCSDFYLCPYKKLKNYCTEAAVHNFLDNPFTLLYCLFISFWGFSLLLPLPAIFFVMLWKQKEKYLNWMWELCHNTKQNIFIRPEFEMTYTKNRRSSLTGIYKKDNMFISKALRYIVSVLLFVAGILIALLICGLMIAIKYLLFYLYPESLTEPWGYQFHVVIAAIVSVAVMIVAEKVYKWFSYGLTSFDNHPTDESYERSLVTKVFTYSFILTFTMVIYFAWLKGIYFKIPSFFFEWSYLMLRTLNCGPFSCLIQVCTVSTVILLCKQILWSLINWEMQSTRTDYNQGEKINQTIPCWEKEYRLKTINEDFFLEKYNYLALQFVIMAWIVGVCPLVLLPALLFNIWDIRQTASYILLNCRRPLLYKRSGLGAWRGIFTVIAYTAAAANALTLVRSTRTIRRFAYFLNEKKTTMDGYLNYTLTSFLLESYYPFKIYHKAFKRYDGFLPVECVFGERYEQRSSLMHNEPYDRYVVFMSIIQKRDSHELRMYEVLSFIIFEIFVLFVAAVVHYLFMITTTKEIQETMAIENRIINTHSKIKSRD